MPKFADFRIIPPLDTYPSVVALAQRPLGKALLLGVYACGLSLYTDTWPFVTLALAALTFLPRYRPMLLVAATFAMLIESGWSSLYYSLERTAVAPPAGALVKTLVVAAVLAAFACYYRAVRLAKGQWLGQRPVRNLIVFYLGLLVVADRLSASAAVTGVLWAFAAVLGKYLWFFNYALLDRNAKDTAPLPLQVGHFLPFWGGTNVPFPKGASYLRKIEAKTPAQLAVCQIKGVKLLAWAQVLAVLQGLLWQLFYGRPGDSFMGISFSLAIPSFSTVLHTPHPWHVNWLALVAGFVFKLVAFSIWGHRIIATCRMAGYQALRNTCNPLRSCSIAEFWNRYYYYFKELLVENFFYPAFLRYWKKTPRLRLFFATMAAAGFGNVLFHFLRDLDMIIEQGLWPALRSFHVYMFYGLVLGTAIALSQLRPTRKPAEMSWLRRNIVAPARVIGFYCLLSIFDEPDRSLVITDHLAFLLRLIPLPPD